MTDESNIKLRQQKLLDILKAILVVCEKNDIKIMGYGGTCLGAVRHKGFIPWDDDIDLLISRKEYKRFKEIINKELPEQYRFYSPQELGYGNLGMGRVFDENTTFIARSKHIIGNYAAGIYVDVSILDGVSDNLIIRKFITKVNNLIYFLAFIRNRRFGSFKHKSSAFLYIISFPLKCLLILFTRNDMFINIHEWLYRKYDFEKCTTVSFNWARRGARRYLPSYLFKETTMLQFEDIMIPCPKDYDTYLKIHYGNYMEIPPENKRKIHEPYFVDLNHSYKNYNPKTGKFDKDIKK